MSTLFQFYMILATIWLATGYAITCSGGKASGGIFCLLFSVIYACLAWRNRGWRGKMKRFGDSHPTPR